MREENEACGRFALTLNMKILRKDKARGEPWKQAPPDPFERPLRRPRVGSSIATSGPTLNPLPAARDGW